MNSNKHNIDTMNKNKLAFLDNRLFKVTNLFKWQCLRFYNKNRVGIQNLSFERFLTKVKHKILHKKVIYNFAKVLE